MTPPDVHNVDQLLAEFIDLYNAGEVPDPDEFIGRAGDQAPTLARRLITFMELVPAPDPTEAGAERALGLIGRSLPPKPDRLQQVAHERVPFSVRAATFNALVKSWATATRQRAVDLLEALTKTLPAPSPELALELRSFKGEVADGVFRKTPGRVVVEPDGTVVLSGIYVPPGLRGGVLLVSFPAAVDPDAPPMVWRRQSELADPGPLPRLPVGLFWARVADTGEMERLIIGKLEGLEQHRARLLELFADATARAFPLTDELNSERG